MKKIYLNLALLLLGSIPAMLAQTTVTGTVLDNTGEPLPGVNIVSTLESNLGVFSGVDGTYQIALPNAAQDTLIFSFIGYQTQRIPVQGRTTIDVTMAVQQQMLDDVVVVGYGVQRKSDLTGSISKIDDEQITRIPTPNVTQALQGQVAGVQITPTSGRPGAGAAIRIRGIGTTNDNTPLFVVDGMILSDNTSNLDFLNPNDIESIEVLKDASATAIYGARGANGVVIVTTKKGSFDQDPTISFNSYYGWQQVTDRVDVVNAAQYAQLTNEAAVNEGGTAPYDNPEQFGAGTDWQDLIFRTAPIQNYNLSARGGSERMNYSLSFDYQQQEGIVRGSDYERFSVRLNNEYQAHPNITFGHNISLVYDDRLNGPTAVNTALRSSPIAVPFDENGDFSASTASLSSTGNIEASFFYNDNTSFSYRGTGNVYADVTFLKNFRFRTNFGLDLSQSQGESFVPVFEVSPIQQNEDSRISINENRNRSWLWENTLNYQLDLGDHRLTALAGITSQEAFNEFLGAGRTNLIGEEEALQFINAGDETTAFANGGASEWSMLSYLFRANYTAFDKYLLTVSFRRDGSSRFGQNFRYGNFPSVALGWNVTNEPFMYDQEWISRLKIRGSWGLIGNDRIGNYESIAVVASNQNVIFGDNSVLENVQNGATILALANNDLRWEETEQYNFGIEAGFLNNRLTAEIDYYNRTTNDILARIPIPDYIGSASNPIVNSARVRNQGIDLKLNWQDDIGDFSYGFNLVGSTVNNEVLALGGNRSEIFGGFVQGGNLATRTVVGGEIGAFYGYQIAGVFQNADELQNLPTRGTEGGPGDLRFADLNGRDENGELTGEPDGVIDEADRTVLGSPIPDFIYGFSFNARYKGFDLVVDFNGQSGNEIYNEKKAFRFGNYNFETSYLDRWTGEGTSNFEPRVTNAGHNYIPSERFIEDGSFLRLRNITLGYTFPKELLGRANIQNLRIYVGGTNLITWTDYTGYTPEIVNANNPFDTGFDSGIFPIARTYTVGINFSF